MNSGSDEYLNGEPGAAPGRERNSSDDQVDRLWRGYDPRAAVPLIAIAIVASATLLAGRWYLDDLTAALVPYAIVLALWPVMLALSIAAKWLIIGRYRQGAYPLWGSYYLRWWLVARLQALSGAGILAGTPLMSVYYRLMGARVGRDCMLDTALCSSFDLVTIGDGTSIGAETQLPGYRVENGALLIGRVDIGSKSRDCAIERPQ